MPELQCFFLLQQDINDKMRAILVDWLVEVHLKFKVTYHLDCNNT